MWAIAGRLKKKYGVEGDSRENVRGGRRGGACRRRSSPGAPPPCVSGVPPRKPLLPLLVLTRMAHPPRAQLYLAANDWVAGLKGRRFMGGSQPNLADLATFGVIRAVTGTGERATALAARLAQPGAVRLLLTDLAAAMCLVPSPSHPCSPPRQTLLTT